MNYSSQYCGYFGHLWGHILYCIYVYIYIHRYIEVYIYIYTCMYRHILCLPIWDLRPPGLSEILTGAHTESRGWCG